MLPNSPSSKRWQRILMLCAFVTLLSSVGGFALRTSMPRLGWTLSIVTFVGAMSIVFIWRTIIKNRRREVRAAHYRLCPWCEYSLVGLEERGVCPECGASFNPDRLIVEWHRRLGNCEAS